MRAHTGWLVGERRWNLHWPGWPMGKASGGPSGGRARAMARRAGRRLGVPAVALLAAALAGCGGTPAGEVPGRAPHDRPSAGRRPAFNPVIVLPRPLPAITEFPVVAADDPRHRIDDSELVLGVVVRGAARAYPLNMLTGPYREILNDQLGGRAIAATW